MKLFRSPVLGHEYNGEAIVTFAAALDGFFGAESLPGHSSGVHFMDEPGAGVGPVILDGAFGEA